MSGIYLVNELDYEKIKREPLRDGFGRGLVEAGRRYSHVFALVADLSDSTRISWFAKEFPERFVEIGIAEQNLVTVASGLAAMGKMPFASSYAAFNPGRNWEQIKTTIALNDLPVKIVGSHAGLITGPDGATHQMLEDIALMRSLPTMIVVVPADAVEAEKATLALAEDPRPGYLRLARDATPVITSERTPFSLKRAQVFSSGHDISIIATGTMTYEAMLAAERLYPQGIDAEVVHVPVIKPLDAVTILRSISRTEAVITVEEAQVNGGLGSAIAELVAENHPVKLKRMGIQDRFGESGQPRELLKKYGLTARDIEVQVKHLLTEMGRM